MIEGDLLHPLPWPCGGIDHAEDLLPVGVFRLLLAQVSLDVMAVHTGSPLRLAGDHMPTQVTAPVLLVIFWSSTSGYKPPSNTPCMP